jgi:hypothetical protein
MKKIVGFEKIYGERFQVMGITWEVQEVAAKPQYTPFALRIVDGGKWKDGITYKIISCFLDFYTKPTLEFWCDGGHLHTVMLKPSDCKTKTAFLGTIVEGMLALKDSGQLENELHLKKKI